VVVLTNIGSASLLPGPLGTVPGRAIEYACMHVPLTCSMFDSVPLSLMMLFRAVNAPAIHETAAPTPACAWFWLKLLKSSRLAAFCAAWIETPPTAPVPVPFAKNMFPTMLNVPFCIETPPPVFFEIVDRVSVRVLLEEEMPAPVFSEMSDSVIVSEPPDDEMPPPWFVSTLT